jgi:hypothetical protein
MTHTERWHVPQEDLARYARQTVAIPEAPLVVDLIREAASVAAHA